MAGVDDQVARLEEKLRQLLTRQARVEERRRALATRRSRRDELRRRILVGTAVLGRVDQGVLPEAELQRWLDEALTRPEDRALFGL